MPDTRMANARSGDFVGRVLSGKWRIDRLLGVGGMSAVYAATHRNGRRAAVKVLREELASNPSARRRFLREGYVANRVNHPGAVVVLDDEVDPDGTVFLVMELLEGETIAFRQRRLENGLPIGEILYIADQLLDVLAAAHASKIVHRDVKPENVFVTRDGSVKLLDFGIARIREIPPDMDADTTASTGRVFGTPAFMAPEQARGRFHDVDEQTDVWAAGALLFWLLTGRHVHVGETPNEILIATATQPAPPLAVFAPHVAPRIAAIVDRALRVDKRSRWASAATMQHALREASGLSPPSSPALLRQTPSKPPASSRPVYFLPFAGAALAAVVSTALIIGRLGTASSEPAPDEPRPTVASAPEKPDARLRTVVAGRGDDRPRMDLVPSRERASRSTRSLVRSGTLERTRVPSKQHSPSPRRMDAGTAPEVRDLSDDEVLDQRL